MSYAVFHPSWYSEISSLSYSLSQWAGTEGYFGGLKELPPRVRHLSHYLSLYVCRGCSLASATSQELMIPSLFFNNMTLYIFSLLILILLSCSINYVDSFSSTPGSAIISITSRSIPTKRCSSSRAPTTRLLMSAGEAALPMPLEEEGTFCV